MNISAIIVDDEEKALKSLELKIQRFFPEITIVNTFQNPKEAIVFINENKSDILFLDVEMPVLSGFDVLAALNSLETEIIFVTAYSEYAIEAFKHCAIGYIVKPIDNDELNITVTNALKCVEEKQANAKNALLLDRLIVENSTPSKITIPTHTGLSFYEIDDVIHLEGDDGYTKIHLQNRTTIMSSYNIGKFEKMLCNTFFKCHKSHIINISKVNSYLNEGYVILENGNKVPVSKTYKKDFLTLISS